MQPLVIVSRWMLGISAFSKILMQYSQFSLLYTSVRKPTPFALMHSHTMIPPPPCFTVGWLQCSINSSPAILLTYTLPSLLCKRSLDSSLKMTWDHCSAVHSLWVRANSRQAFLCHDVRRGFFLGFRPMSPASLGLLLVVDVDTHTMLKLHLRL